MFACVNLSNLHENMISLGETVEEALSNFQEVFDETDSNINNLQFFKLENPMKFKLVLTKV